MRLGLIADVHGNIDALTKDAVIQADDAMLQPIVEMAMQMYSEWRAGVPTP